MELNQDHRDRRCPRLGGAVSFRYCRRAGENHLPCWKLATCWWQLFDVTAWLRCTLDAGRFAQWQATRPQPKMTQILELIEQARQRSTADADASEPEVKP